MFSMTNLNPHTPLVQSRVVLFLHHIALLWSATINNSGSINIALLRSEEFCKSLWSLANEDLNQSPDKLKHIGPFASNEVSGFRSSQRELTPAPAIHRISLHA